MQRRGTRIKNVFISYATSDRYFAQELKVSLESQAGVAIAVFLDEKSIDFAQPINDSVNHGLRRADSVIVLLSENSRDSDWVKFEIGAAWGLRKHIVPVMLATVELPVVANPLKYVDARQDPFEAVRQVTALYIERFKT